jgi:hypothetical protein
MRLSEMLTYYPHELPHAYTLPNLVKVTGRQMSHHDGIMEPHRKSPRTNGPLMDI